MTARADTAEHRLRIYAGLANRNRVISFLRVVVPASGAVALLFFAAKLLLASFASAFGIGDVHFDGATVTVSTPTYSGALPDGDLYQVSADAAQASVTDLNVIQLTRPRLVLTAKSGGKTTAKADGGTFNTQTQLIEAAGNTEVVDGDGNVATLARVTVDLTRQLVHAAAPAHVVLKDGTVIDGQQLDYDMKTKHWDFGRATLTLPQTPGDAPLPSETAAP